MSAQYLGVETDLSANEFAGGAIGGQGFVHLESFAVQDLIPVWRYAVADALLEQRIFMAPGPIPATCAWNCCAHRSPCG